MLKAVPSATHSYVQCNCVYNFAAYTDSRLVAARESRLTVCCLAARSLTSLVFSPFPSPRGSAPFVVSHSLSSLSPALTHFSRFVSHSPSDDSLPCRSGAPCRVVFTFLEVRCEKRALDLCSRRQKNSPALPLSGRPSIPARTFMCLAALRNRSRIVPCDRH